jgi:hypothetical protein
MNIYKKYSDKTIRNKPDQDELERAFTEEQAREAADRILAQYRDEPSFLTEITGKLIDGIKAQTRKAQRGQHHEI